MIILGIDPGYSLIGISIVEEKKQSIKLLKANIIDTSHIKDFNEKLLKISETISEILQNFSPNVVCIEELFFNKNTKTAIKVAQAIGVIKIEIIKRNIPIIEITPLEVKKYITGTKGKHPKIQIQNLVKIILGLEELPKPDDVADSIAIAIAGLSKIKSKL